ncbi:hypothetical protein TSOC_004394 [Tetrabaena socialis]|uniref:Uncharacterized protein n=1 Tax=Tetrabaena socialis TaxID=47790 RepID=A0A2J8A973_9CHLO|nr:hypothetical protein TSOC_004394 [Tetrabaena socialis]|eukprot:PNH09051.1 hypothetical protein TSOC_004394 [Tetrabaena socialis]
MASAHRARSGSPPPGPARVPAAHRAPARSAARGPRHRTLPALLRLAAAWPLLLSLHAAAAEDAASAGSASAPAVDLDFYSKLVTVPSNLYGEVKKAGPMPAERYDDALFNHTNFRDWLLRKAVLREEVAEPAPMSYKCGVFVNHHYKLIFIRNRKAASTTVLDVFKVACKSQSKLLCLRPFGAQEMAAAGLRHDDMWNSYYVVSSTRNPWARAASGYDYTQDRWPTKTGVCANIPFRQFCADPYMMGKMANLFRCGTQSSFRGDDAWAYDFYHIEPAHHCMTDASGQGLSVDYLIRYEHLNEDFAALLEILNKRREKKLPEIRAGRMRWMKQGVHVQAARVNATADGSGGTLWHEDAAALVSADRHAVRYRDCGMGCVRDVAAFFAKDIELMGMQMPPDPPTV